MMMTLRQLPLLMIVLVSLTVVPSVRADCTGGDIMYSEGDSMGYIGYECVNETHFEGTESVCGANGTAVETDILWPCPDDAGVPYCVQCGPRGYGAALCKGEPAVPDHCENGTASDTADGGNTSSTSSGATASNSTESATSTANGMFQQKGYRMTVSVMMGASLVS